MKARTLLIPAILASLASSAFAAATVVYSDNFNSYTFSATGTDTAVVYPAAGFKTAPQVNLLGGDSQWYGKSSANMGTTATVAGSQALGIKGANTGLFGYFANNPIDVGVANGYLKIQFDFEGKAAGTGSGNMRVGLLNSRSEPTYQRSPLFANGAISEGNSSATVSNSTHTMVNWTGYYLHINPNSGSFTLAENMKGASGKMVSAASNATTAAPISGTSTVSTIGKLLGNTAYRTTVEFLNNNDGTLTITGTLGVIGGTASESFSGVFAIDTNDPVTADSNINTGIFDVFGGTKFDTIAFNGGSSANPMGPNLIGIDNLVVSTIPEPATYAACLGALSLLVVGYRRFRR